MKAGLDPQSEVALLVANTGFDGGATSSPVAGSRGSLLLSARWAGTLATGGSGACHFTRAGLSWGLWPWDVFGRTLTRGLVECGAPAGEKVEGLIRAAAGLGGEDRQS
jgi:hypothetical protein